jgi:hypothetical protein
VVVGCGGVGSWVGGGGVGRLSIGGVGGGGVEGGAWDWQWMEVLVRVVTVVLEVVHGRVPPGTTHM